MESSPIRKRPDDSNHWILNLIGLLFFGFIAWLSYTKLTRYETLGGYLSLPKILMLFYDVIGKWGVIGFWLLLVFYNFIKGLILIFKHK